MNTNKLLVFALMFFLFSIAIISSAEPIATTSATNPAGNAGSSGTVSSTGETTTPISTPADTEKKVGDQIIKEGDKVGKPEDVTIKGGTITPNKDGGGKFEAGGIDTNKVDLGNKGEITSKGNEIKNMQKESEIEIGKKGEIEKAEFKAGKGGSEVKIAGKTGDLEFSVPEDAKVLKNKEDKTYQIEIAKEHAKIEKEPVKKWKQVDDEIKRILTTLNKLKIEKVKVKAKNVDLVVGLGKNRQWLGGRGCNIPSFEVFISPDFRKTEGKISFDQPLYRYGNIVKGISLEFKNGKVVKASAKHGEKVLKEMIAVEGANQIGEFSLTDVRFSKITKFMAETLYDENFGGKYGNTHIALGNAYQDSYVGNPSKVPKSKWKKMGFNESVIHTDIVSTENRIVTAELEDGSKRIIYKNGKFTIWLKNNK